MDKIHRLDWQYLKQKPEGDPNFSPEHNKRVIENTIKKTDRMRRQKQREFEEKLRERTWASGKYIKHIEKGGESDPVKFFGKDYTMYLKGKEIMDRLAEASDATKPEGDKKAVA